MQRLPPFDSREGGAYGAASRQRTVSMPPKSVVSGQRTHWTGARFDHPLARAIYVQAEGRAALAARTRVFLTQFKDAVCILEPYRRNNVFR